MATERYVAELIALSKSNEPLSEALVHFEQIFDAYMIEGRAPSSRSERPFWMRFGK
jgi:hypothetical protein